MLIGSGTPNLGSPVPIEGRRGGIMDRGAGKEGPHQGDLGLAPTLPSPSLSMPNIDKPGDAPDPTRSSLREQFKQKQARAASLDRAQAKDDSVEPMHRGARSDDPVNPDEIVGEHSGQKTAGTLPPSESGGGTGGAQELGPVRAGGAPSSEDRGERGPKRPTSAQADRASIIPSSSVEGSPRQSLESRRRTTRRGRRAPR